MADVTIVGGGLAGLIAANLLAKAGKSVLVLEQGKGPGGRARTDDEQGYRFNLGPHALYKAGDAARILRDDLDIVPAGKIAPAQGALLLRDKRTYLLPRALSTLIRTRALGIAAKLAVAKAFNRLPAIDPLPLQSITLRDWLRRSIGNEEASELLLTIFRVSTYANDPERQSAGAAIRQLQCGLAGVYYLDGGWQAMVDSLETSARRRGVQFEYSTRAQQLCFEGDRVVGLRTSKGENIPSEWVLLAIPPQASATILVDRPDFPIHQFARQSVPVHAACLNVGLRKLPKPQHRFLLGMDEPLYYSVHSLTAQLAPPGGAVIQLARYMGSEGEPSADETRLRLEKLLDQLQPGWQQYLVTKQYLPKMMVVPALDLASQGGLSGRFAMRMPGASQLLFAGDWVGPDGMLADASAASAYAAAQAILQAPPREGRVEAMRHVANV